ncbi:MAG TPA: hypothetical protein VIJ67_04375 [Pseudolabrys sp.]
MRWLRRLKSEIALGFLIATVFWTAILGWQAAYAPTEVEKEQCYKAAQHAGHKTEECKTLWQRTTSDPVALFTFGLFIFTAVLAASTIALWVETRSSGRRQSRETRATIKVSQAANVINRNMLLTSHRPWLAVVDIALTGPVIFAKDDGMRASVQVTLQNTGNIPALDVFPWIEGWAMGFNGHSFPRERLREISQSVKTALDGGPYAIFPGQPPAGELTEIFISIDLMRYWLPGKDERSFHPYILGCIGYRNPTDGSHHQTWFAAMFQFSDPKFNVIDPANIPDEVVSLDQVGVQSFYGWHAD